jgi:hypothetical protein
MYTAGITEQKSFNHIFSRVNVYTIVIPNEKFDNGKNFPMIYFLHKTRFFLGRNNSFSNYSEFFLVYKVINFERELNLQF